MAFQLVITNKTQRVINKVITLYIVKPPYDSHAIFLPVQMKAACFLLCMHTAVAIQLHSS